MNKYTYEVDYAVDHEAMQRGEFQTSKVKVEAHNEAEANLLAAQMVGHRGIPVATRHVSTQFEVRLASHGREATIEPGDVIVDASGVPGHEVTLKDATVKSTSEALGGGQISYVSKYGHHKIDYPKGGNVIVERPARG